jgi:ribosomal protein L40E
MYCRKCGNKLADDDQFCQKCGEEILRERRFNPVKKSDKPNDPPSQQPSEPKKSVHSEKSPEKGDASVKYVLVDEKTGKITKNPPVKSRTESVAQWMTVAFIAVAVIIVMIAGSMFISGYMANNVFKDKFSVNSDTSSTSGANDGNSEAVSSEYIWTEVSSTPPELLAENLQSRIKGTWTTDLPYKSMTIPATLTFDGSGKCSCNLKALFISKSFDGNYTINDGGGCSVTLNGIGEYVEGSDTLTGSISFSSDDNMTFKSDNTVWQLVRVTN